MAEEENDDFLSRDRICPSCRSTINILAVKCKFCGEDIGKPKEEQRELTVQDLGGEAIYHRAPSGTVIGAIEAYRVEEFGGSGSDDGLGSDDGIRRDVPQEPARVGPDGLPILDAKSQSLSSLSESSFSARATVVRPPKTLKDRALPIGLGIVGLLVLIFGGIKGVTAYMAYLEEKNRVPVIVVVNRYYEIVARGGTPVAALRAAHDALVKADNDENRAIGSEALAVVERQILDLLNRTDWSMETIHEAAGLGETASLAYPHALTTRLKEMTREESNSYNMSLLTIDKDGGSAKLKLQDGTTVEIRQGGRIKSRFNVVRVTTAHVELEDQIRKSRGGGQRVVTLSLTNVIPH